MLLLKNIFVTMSSMKNTSGFTLVEIIIVVCVVGIISTVTLVSYSKLRENAYDAAAKETLHQVETAFKAYVAGGNKVPLRHYKNIGFYDSPGGGSMDLGIKVFSGGGIGLAMHKANYLPDDLLNTLKNGPKKDPYLKNNIGFATCGKNKAFFYIEVYNGGITQRELNDRVYTQDCSSKTHSDWLAEHRLPFRGHLWTTGLLRSKPRYIVAEIDFDNEPLDSD